ncbi:MAG: methionyl-tRNA formyltransferase [Solirubrobacteraceae bacterium]
MRTVFFGTSEFALGVLERLLAGGHLASLVVTRPDRPRGRGRRPSPPPVAQGARALDLPLAQPERVNEPHAIEQIARARPDVIVVCAFGAIIAEPLLSLREILNVHPSLLPRWRGAAPIERAIVAGDEQTGVCVMRLTEALDSGPVCLSERETIAAEDDYGSLAARLCALGGELIVQALDAIDAGGTLSFVEQDDAAATYAEKIGAEDRLLAGDRSALELSRLVRALHPHIGARLSAADGSLLRVGRARALTDERGGATPAPGALRTADGRLLFGASDGPLELLEVQPPGGRPMDARSYLRGHQIDAL